jgi:hypothetical protein
VPIRQNFLIPLFYVLNIAQFTYLIRLDPNIRFLYLLIPKTSPKLPKKPHPKNFPETKNPLPYTPTSVFVLTETSINPGTRVSRYRSHPPVSSYLPVPYNQFEKF